MGLSEDQLVALFWGLGGGGIFAFFMTLGGETSTGIVMLLLGPSLCLAAEYLIRPTTWPHGTR